MDIHIFTIRNKATNELLYAEGTSEWSEYHSFFKLANSWLTDEEKQRAGWRQDYNKEWSYREEVRHLMNYEYEFIKFAMEVIDYE